MRKGHWKRWLGIGILATGIALVAGPYVFIHFVEADPPAPLELAVPSPSSGGGSAGSGESTAAAGGTWKVASGSVAGYRVKEVLFGQSHEAVGRTGQITGSIRVEGATVTAATFTVDMTTVTTDQDRRDAQFNGRIMETGVYPTATFTLTGPIRLGSIPAEGVERTARAEGRLTLHGVTKQVVFEVTGRSTGSTLQVAGSIPIAFADWNIPNPSFGPVTTEDGGVLEFALNLTHA